MFGYMGGVDVGMCVSVPVWGSVENDLQVWPGANSVEVPPRNGRGPERYGSFFSSVSCVIV